MKKKVILILLDACRGDYITQDNTPFLHNLAKHGRYYKFLVPSFGFCERTEILVGQDGLESGCFTAFGYSPEASPYKRFRHILKVFGTIEECLGSAFFSKVIRRALWEIFRYMDGAFYPARIPLGQLGNFCLTEDGALNQIENDNRSIYSRCESVFLGATTSLSEYLSGTDQSRLDGVLKALDEPYDFYPTYISEIDGIGHVYGPHSVEMREALGRVDRQIKGFYETQAVIENSATLVICGDHGMSPVVHQVNIEAIVMGLMETKTISKKVSMFLDSTMARFWSSEDNDDLEELKVAVDTAFSEFGYFVAREDYIDNGIPDSRMYGDLIWLCNEGVVLSPDYFTPANKNILGMHGYKPTGPQHYGFCLVVGDKVEQCSFDNPQPLTKAYIELAKHFR